MRNLNSAELNLVFGGDETGSGTVVVIGNPLPSDPSGGQLSNPTGNGGSGGGTGSPTASQVLQGLTRVTIGKHNVLVPADASETPAEKAGVQAFEKGLQIADTKVANIADTSTVQITERWTDSAGHLQIKTYTETGADFKAAWNRQSFAIIPDATLANNKNLDPNSTGRSGSNLGPDPYNKGNIVAGFALDETITKYYANATANNHPASNGVGAEMYLALHEVAHNTQAGVALANDTGPKIDNSPSGTPNYANENGANTLAISLAKAVGLDLGTIATIGDYGPRNGYDPNSSWSVPSSSGNPFQSGGWQ